MLEKKIEELGSYFDGMFRIDSSKICVRTIFPKGWTPYNKKTDTYTISYRPIMDEGITKFIFIGDKNTSFEIIVDFIIEVVTSNQENERKKELFQTKCLELAKVFDSNRLSKLENLVFKFEKPKKEKKVEEPIKEIEVDTKEVETIANEDTSEIDEIRRLAEQEG